MVEFYLNLRLRQSTLLSFLWVLDSIRHKIWWEVAAEFDSEAMQCPLHSSRSKRRQWGGWETTGQMSSGSGLMFCFSCRSPYSFTTRKCRPISSLNMPALPSHWRKSMARFGMTIMRRCVSKAWPTLARNKRTGARLRFPDTYPAPLVFCTDICLCQPLWCTPLCAEGAELRKGGADKGNAGSRQVMHPHPDPPLLPPPTAPFTTSDSGPLNPMSNSAADHEQTIWCVPGFSWRPKMLLWPWYGYSSNSRADEGTGVCLGRRLRDGNLGRDWYWSCTNRVLLILLIPSSWLSWDLMTHGTETAPNPRICMAAPLQIDEENMSKVRS